ncbi:uncharacterized protein [Neodiprion pinetum]|uniref:uncharacterized protein n=1 Tax=Neodiprion pinetum TaxID=441929 RepID=UPI001EDF97B9|nr:uncharacterized protein LOC124223262 [Neodiprion pinetum]
MKKGSQCIARTINLSNTKNSAPPRQVQKLVNADVRTPCPDSRSSYRSSRPVPVRVCMRRDVERTLPPKLCECSQKPPPETLVTKIRWLANGLLKSVIAAGLVYWTTAEGVWGDSEETENLYGRIVKSVSPVLPNVVDVKDTKVPHLENVRHKLLDGYNRAVLSIVGLTIGVPTKLEEKMSELFFPCEEVSSGDKGAGNKNFNKLNT